MADSQTKQHPLGTGTWVTLINERTDRVCPESDFWVYLLRDTLKRANRRPFRHFWPLDLRP
ncbi:MAG: hypothetical protein P8J91_00520 [Pirellulaceae bacterium]|nr:hypothetical protein [Pirellulaceae bacterium]